MNDNTNNTEHADMDPPPPEAFELQPDDNDEDTWQDLFRDYLRRFGAFIIIILMLYVYGIHQGLLFQRTDTGVESDNEYIPHEVLREDDLIVLPVRVFVLVNPEEGSTRTQEDVNRVIDSASEIWDQAKIDLSVTQVEFIELDDEQVTSFFSNPAPQIRTIADPRPGEINLFLSRALSGLNGVAFRGLESVAVADYTTSFDFRVLAHEIGHVLNLDHISSDRSHLMYQGGHGTVIPYESAKKARTAAQKFLKQRE